MIITEKKDLKEILPLIEGHKLFVIGCDICAKLCHTGGEKEVGEYCEFLQEKGFEILGKVQLDGVCNELLTRKFIKDNQEILNKVDTVIMASCGNGTQVFRDLFTSAKIIPVTNTMFLGSLVNHHKFRERCSMCGECLLGLTEGICPHTECPKGILNGPCGGSENGKCEVDRDRECAWYRIYTRLKERGKEGKLNNIFPPANHTIDTKPRKISDRKNEHIKK